MKTLRAATADLHSALEAHPLSQAIVSSRVSRGDYVHYLQLMERVVAESELALFPLAVSALPNIKKRAKQDWIAADIAYFSGGANSFAPFSLKLKENSLPYSLGALYVTEGSTLGGRVILKLLPSSLGITDLKGAAYFTGYGNETGYMWQEFLRIFVAVVGDDPQSQESAILGATDMFASILQYFNDCAAHET